MSLTRLKIMDGLQGEKKDQNMQGQRSKEESFVGSEVVSHTEYFKRLYAKITKTKKMTLSCTSVGRY